MTKTLRDVVRNTEKRFVADRAPLDHKRKRMVERHQSQRRKFNQRIEKMQRQGERRRAARLPTGILGALFGFFTGRTAAIKKQNTAEAEFDKTRISAMQQDFRNNQLGERLELQTQYRSLAKQHHHEREELRKDIDFYVRQASPSRSEVMKDHLKELNQKPVIDKPDNVVEFKPPKKDKGLDID